MKKHYEHSLHGMMEAAMVENTAAYRRDFQKPKEKTRTLYYRAINAKIMDLMSDGKKRDRYEIGKHTCQTIEIVSRCLRLLRQTGALKVIPHETKGGDRFSYFVVESSYIQKETSNEH